MSSWESYFSISGWHRTDFLQPINRDSWYSCHTRHQHVCFLWSSCWRIWRTILWIFSKLIVIVSQKLKSSHDIFTSRLFESCIVRMNVCGSMLVIKCACAWLNDWIIQSYDLPALLMARSHSVCFQSCCSGLTSGLSVPICALNTKS